MKLGRLQKGIVELISITQDEANLLRENGRGEDVHIASKTHKSRGKSYYATENPKTLELIENYRKDHILYSYGNDRKR